MVMEEMANTGDKKLKGGTKGGENLLTRLKRHSLGVGAAAMTHTWALGGSKRGKGGIKWYRCCDKRRETRGGKSLPLGGRVRELECSEGTRDGKVLWSRYMAPLGNMVAVRD